MKKSINLIGSKKNTHTQCN